MYNHTQLSIRIFSVTILSLASGARDARAQPAADVIARSDLVTADLWEADGDGVVLSLATVPAASPAQAAFNFFVSKGLSKVQATGIVGNLMQESGVNSSSVQVGGPGRGIAQWSVGGRWDTSPGDNLRWYAATHRMPPGALNTQLNFIWYELTTFRGYGLAALRAASTVAQAAHVFATSFEACGVCNERRRIAFAQSALDAFGRTTRLARRRP